MTTFWWIVVGVAANYLLGCIVLPAIDDEDHNLFHWARSCERLPGTMFVLVVMLWPLVAFWFLRDRWRKG
jgi:hypothetical protein